MLPTRLEAIDEALPAAACREHWPESQVLDFKRALPAADEKGRSELAKDVSAFAYAECGDLVYGIAKHEACANQPQPITAEAAHAANRRLLQVLGASIEPRIVGLQLHTVPFAAGGYALFLRVPASFDGPHRFLDGGQWRWGQLRAPADRADLMLPDLLLDRLEADDDIDAIARPLLDILWQSIDVERCYEYDKDGKWRPRP